jgi:hypothetical protein
MKDIIPLVILIILSITIFIALEIEPKQEYYRQYQDTSRIISPQH